MNILIDGYNLLKQLLGTKEISEKQRRLFSERAAGYARRKGHNLYIVYDGGPYTRQSQIMQGRVTTIYSGHKDTADDVIIGYIEDKRLQNLLLVTTDRELNVFADQYGIPSIDSLDFYEFMKGETPQVSSYKRVSGKAYKLHPEHENQELDALMQEGASKLYFKVEENESQAYDTKGSSKKEKRLLAVLNKL